MCRYLYNQLLEVMILANDSHNVVPDLEQAITKKIKGMNRTRNNRINASRRLYNYKEHWDFIFLVMNVFAIILLILSISNIDISHLTVISNIFSLYALILQYYINNFNYSERALRFHFQELEIEKSLLELKELLREVSIGESDNECENNKKFTNIIEKYVIEIKGTENHSSYDDMKRDYDENKNYQARKPRDFSMDKIIIVINYFVLVFAATYLFLGMIGFI